MKCGRSHYIIENEPEVCFVCKTTNPRMATIYQGICPVCRLPREGYLIIERTPYLFHYCGAAVYRVGWNHFGDDGSIRVPDDAELFELEPVGAR